MPKQPQSLGYWEAVAAIEQLCLSRRSLGENYCRATEDHHERGTHAGGECTNIASADPLTVLIDGRSGSGKTTLASDLAQRV